jgi:hypothetical protein
MQSIRITGRPHPQSYLKGEITIDEELLASEKNMRSKGTELGMLH